MGTDINDYNLALKFFQEDHPNLDNKQAYDQAQQETASLLENEGDVYCLQETGELEQRPLIQNLQQKNFTIIQAKGKSPVRDAVIALNPNRFTDIENHSISREIAVAVATDQMTHRRLAFVSGHMEGFSLTLSPEEILENELATGGDQQCHDLVAKLKELEKTTDIQIIGGDMNASPKTWYNRFHIFEEAGFNLMSTNGTTALNSNDKTLREREIDYFFVKNQQAVKPLHWQERNISKPLDHWNVNSNASDHTPIKLSINPTMMNPLLKLYSLLTRLWAWVTAPFQGSPSPATAPLLTS